MNRIDIHTRAHCRGGVMCVEMYGSCNPKLWAVGRQHTVVAEPSSPDVAELDGPTVTMMLSAMTFEVDAWAIGRTVEAFIQIVDDPSQVTYRAGDLALNAEFDPTIRTAIVCEGFDKYRHEVALWVAKADLTDEGQPTWDYQPGQHADPRFINILRGVDAYDQRAKAPLINMYTIQHNTGWRAARFPTPE